MSHDETKRDPKENARERRETLRGLLSPSLHAWERNEPSEETRMKSLLTAQEPPQESPVAPEPPSTPSRGHFASSTGRGLNPSLLSLIHSMVQELWERSPQLLTLNPSRRESILTHLQALAQSPTMPRATLKDWIENQRGTTESRAFSAYFEEVATLTLCQAILLKRWSDLESRAFRKDQLGRMNYEFSTQLKPFVPLHRESWHLTRPNIYSWYTPSPSMLDELEQILQGLPMTDEGPGVLLELGTEGRRFHAEQPESVGYDSRFYQSILGGLPTIGVDLTPLPFNRKRFLYTPTLRFGSVNFHVPAAAQWVGFEQSLFQLLVAEMIQLWWGPKGPPDWANGTSLEAHPREQLSLAAATAPRGGVLQFLSEVEACDFSWLIEERTQKSSKFKAQLEGLPFFKKLAQTQTPIGLLQACVALTKLRPYGKLFWARETPLTPEEGSEAINFLFARGTLLAEWDLSHLDHQLPSRCPLFPKYWYVFEREIDTESRSTHRPKRIQVTGSLKSHVEIPVMLDECLRSLHAEGTTPISSGRSQWKIHQQVTPTPQKDWLTHWPTAAQTKDWERLDQLKEFGVPLASIGTIRHLSHQQLRPEWRGLALEARDAPRELVARNLQSFPKDTQNLSGHLLFLPDDQWTAAIQSYLECGAVAEWLEHNAERKAEKWNLTEALLRLLPVPRRLIEHLQNRDRLEVQWQVQGLIKNPENFAFDIHGWDRFHLLACARFEVENSVARLQTYLGDPGVIHWKNLLKLIPVNELAPLTHSPSLTIQGSLPVHSAIIRAERTKGHLPGISLMTESGSLLKMHSPEKTLIEILHSQIAHFTHPTWGEILEWVRVPRNLAYAESLKQDLAQNRADLLHKSAILKSKIQATLTEIRRADGF